MVDGVKCLSVFDRKGGDMAIRPEVVKRCWRTLEEAGVTMGQNGLVR